MSRQSECKCASTKTYKIRWFVLCLNLLSRLMRLMNAWLFDRLCLWSLWLYLILGTDKSRASLDDPVPSAFKLPCLSKDVLFRCSLADRGGLIGLPSRSNSLSSVGRVAVDVDEWWSLTDWPPTPSAGRCCSWLSISVIIWGRLPAAPHPLPASSFSGCSMPGGQVVADAFLAGVALNVLFSFRSTRLSCFFSPRHEWLVLRPLPLAATAAAMGSGAGVGGSDAVTACGSSTTVVCGSVGSACSDGAVAGINTRASSAFSVWSSGLKFGFGEIWVEYTPTGLRASLLSSSSSSTSSSRPFKFAKFPTICTDYAIYGQQNHVKSRAQTKVVFLSKPYTFPLPVRSTLFSFSII